MHELVEDERSQFIIATHSPILMTYPGGVILRLGTNGIRRVTYEETEHYTVTRDFLNAPDRYFKTLFAKPDDE